MLVEIVAWHDRGRKWPTVRKLDDPAINRQERRGTSGFPVGWNILRSFHAKALLR